MNKNLESDFHQRTPVAQWEIVDVRFGSTPNTPTEVRYKRLLPKSVDQIEYTVLRQLTPGTVYEDRTVGRTPWGNGYIVLNSDTANWNGRLLLTVLKTPVDKPDL